MPGQRTAETIAAIEQKRRDDHKPVNLGNRSICPVCGEDAPCLLVENDELRASLETARREIRALERDLDDAEALADERQARAENAESRLDRLEERLDDLEYESDLIHDALAAAAGSPYGSVQLCVGCNRRVYVEGHNPYCPVGQAQVERGTWLGRPA